MISAFVRHRIIGTAPNISVNQIARRWDVAPPTVSNIRNGKQGVGGEVLLKIANAEYDGSVDDLRADALKFAEEHPELAYPERDRSVMEHALGRLVSASPRKSEALIEAFEECASDSFDKPERLTLEQAERLISERAAARKGKSVGVREHEDDGPPPGRPPGKSRRARRRSRVLEEADRAEQKLQRSLDTGKPGQPGVRDKARNR